MVPASRRDADRFLAVDLGQVIAVERHVDDLGPLRDGPAVVAVLRQVGGVQRLRQDLLDGLLDADAVEAADAVGCQLEALGLAVDDDGLGAEDAAVGPRDDLPHVVVGEERVGLPRVGLVWDLVVEPGFQLSKLERELVLLKVPGLHAPGAEHEIVRLVHGIRGVAAQVDADLDRHGSVVPVEDVEAVEESVVVGEDHAAAPELADAAELILDAEGEVGGLKQARFPEHVPQLPREVGEPHGQLGDDDVRRQAGVRRGVNIEPILSGLGDDRPPPAAA